MQYQTPLHTASFDWFLLTKTFDISSDMIMEDLGLTLPNFEFLSLYLDMFDQNWSFLQKNEDFDQKFLNKGSKTQNLEELILFRSDIP